MNTPEPVSRSSPTAVLAEDEPLLADELADMLQALWPQLRIVARVSDGVAALNAIETHQPDVAFLDIHMPLLTGIEAARQIAGRCHVAFITSYDEHALEAFEAGAMDYVLKPPTPARLPVFSTSAVTRIVPSGRICVALIATFEILNCV